LYINLNINPKSSTKSIKLTINKKPKSENITVKLKYKSNLNLKS